MAVAIVGAYEGDFDAFKQRFEADPLGRKQVAKGHTLLRSVDNPNQFFVRVDFDSADDAKEFAEKVRGSDVMEGFELRLPPTVAEVADQATY
jgi:heme-degrading monooxygenase HmoA